MNFENFYKIIILWIGVCSLIASLECENWAAFGVFTVLVLTAIILKDAEIPSVIEE
jgi:hypothetical protein